VFVICITYYGYYRYYELCTMYYVLCTMGTAVYGAAVRVGEIQLAAASLLCFSLIFP
jgi:hypothetical protein